MGPAVFPLDGDVGHDGQQWHRRRGRLDQTGDQVAGPRTDGRVADADRAGRPGVGVGRVDPAALVVHEYVLDLVLPVGDAVVQRQSLSAWAAEHPGDAVVDQAVDELLTDMSCRSGRVWHLLTF